MLEFESVIVNINSDGSNVQDVLKKLNPEEREKASRQIQNILNFNEKLRVKMLSSLNSCINNSVVDNQTCFFGMIHQPQNLLDAIESFSFTNDEKKLWDCKKKFLIKILKQSLKKGRRRWFWK